MSRFSDWAERRGGASVRSAPAASVQQAQQAQQPQQAPRPMAIALPNGSVTVGTPRLFVPQATDYQTCQIVPPGDRDPYAALLASVPELVTDDLSNGVDAMDLAGVPVEGRMSHWTPTANRQYGGRDVDRHGTLDEHLRARHGVSLAQIRRRG